MPGPCAPLTSVSTPRSASRSMSVAIGRMSAVGLVTWSSSARRVRGVTAASTASTISSGPRTGKGSDTVTTRAPARAATWSRTLRHAL